MQVPRVLVFSLYSIVISVPDPFVILNTTQIDSPMLLTPLSNKEVYNNMGTMAKEYLHHGTWDVLITHEQC